MRCLGRTETDRKITKRAVVVKEEINGTNKTTRGSERSSVRENEERSSKRRKERAKKLKKDLDTSRRS